MNNLKVTRIEKLIKNLSGKAFDNSITGYQTRYKELEEQLRKAYYQRNINIYNKLPEGSERFNFIKYLRKKGL